ncbi:MAG: hypothetical protein HUU20_01090 [Pirellulales bacterium]|nr:hypothetical protein [Pirellulales bacterium]
MLRHLGMGLRSLACVWLLGSGGCSSDQAAVTEPDSPQALETGPADSASSQSLDELALALWQRDIDQYLQHTQDPQTLRLQAEEFLRNVQFGMLPHPRGPGDAKTAQIGKELFQQGCRDPLLKTYYGKAVCSARDCYEAAPALTEALNTWKPSGYPGEFRRLGVFTLFSEMKASSRGSDWGRLRNEAASLAAIRVADATISPEMRRVLLYELMPLAGTGCGGNWEDAAAVHEACSKQPSADPWIVHMLAGRAYVARAWHHRGGDWARNVTPEGWRLFGEYLEKAAGEFTEALKLHPECPEAATWMIVVAAAGESGQTPQAWFDKAVAGEIDYIPAYDNLRWALRPRWGGSHDALYRFGCRCADTRRYDTMVPFVLLQAINDIDEELAYNCEVWRREGVYARVKEMLDAMASDPSRTDGGIRPGRSSVMSVHVAMAERAGQYDEARRLLDELGDRFDREIFDLWCGHPQYLLAGIYAFTGKGSQAITKAWQTLNEAPKPCSDSVLRQIQSLFQNALAADDNEWSKEYCRVWVAELDGRLGFAAGKPWERKFDPKLLCWWMTDGTWSRESEDSAIGHSHRATGRVRIRPAFVPMFPLEVEFGVEAIHPPKYPLTLGLFIPQGARAGVGDTPYHQFFVRTSDNQAGIEIDGDSKTVPCDLKPVNRIRVQLAEGRAVLFVNDQLCLERSEKGFRPQPVFDFGCMESLYRYMRIRVSNVRFRKWEPPP